MRTNSSAFVGAFGMLREALFQIVSLLCGSLASRTGKPRAPARGNVRHRWSDRWAVRYYDTPSSNASSCRSVHFLLRISSKYQ